VLHIDDGILDAVLKLARPNVRVDRKPSQARHLRMHGTDRRDDASGRFTGAGVYRLIGGYDKRGVPLARDYEPTVASDGACWHSVRAGERLVRHLCCSNHAARIRAPSLMSARRLVMQDRSAGENGWLDVCAGGGGRRRSARDQTAAVSHRRQLVCGVVAAALRRQWRAHRAALLGTSGRV
jgi:hypothetical protein